MKPILFIINGESNSLLGSISNKSYIYNSDSINKITLKEIILYY